MTIDMKKLDKITDKVISYNPAQNVPKAICEAPLLIGDSELHCAVLDGGIRVLSQRKVLEAFGRGKQGSKIGANKLSFILASESLKPYINSELTEPTNHIEYQPKTGGRTAYGIKAEILPMICEVFINAAAAGVLKKNQLPTAERCRILQNGFARVGIAALIDEATGYQDIRAKGALAKILEEYLSAEIQPYNRKFPLEFYRQIYRLKGWKWQELENGTKPPTHWIVAKYTDDFIYKRIAPGVLEELRKKNPDRKVRHHQLFNPEKGQQKLKEHIAGVITAMKLSNNWENCIDNIDKAFPLQWTQGTLFYTGK